MKTLTALEAGAARTALGRMVDPARYFNICDFDALCKVVGVSCDGQTRNALQLLHCVNWRDMDQRTRVEATRAIFETFGAAELALPVAEALNSDSPVPLSLWKRLRGAA